jgi:Cu/Ag efflux protein CusF
MKRAFRKTSLTTLSLLALAFTACTVSCSKDDKTTTVDSEQHFTIASWGNGDAQYIAAVPSLSEGKLSYLGTGIEAQGSRYLWHKQYVYLMNLPEKKFIQYEMMKDGTIRQAAYILTDGVVPNYFQSLNVVNDTTLLVLGAVEGNQGTVGWARISTNSFSVIAKGSMSVPYDAAKPGVEFFIGKGFVDNGKFILGGYSYDGSTRSYVADGVQALVYDYPAMTNMKVIKTNATSGGIGYDYLHSLDVDEAGNHYFVVSAGKYWTGLGGNSGVVRIKKGEADFDQSYFFDVTSAVGKQACLMGMNYVSNGIAFGTVQYEDMMTSLRDRYLNIAQVIKMDLQNKTVTVMNTPLSPVGMVRMPLVFNNKYYTGIAPIDGEAAIYEFDPAGDANGFKKGITLDGGGSVQVQLIAPHPTK